MGFKVASRVRGLSDEAFGEAFGTKEQCRAALVRLRWPGGFVCPCCGHREHCVLAGRGLYQCNRCKKQTSPTAGMIFHPRSKLRHRLDLALVAVRGLIAPHHLAHRVLRNPQIPDDLLDRNAPHQMILRIRAIVSTTSISPSPRPSNDKARSWEQTRGGSSLTPDLECAPEGGQVARLELTGNAGLSEDGSHVQAPNLQY